MGCAKALLFLVVVLVLHYSNGQSTEFFRKDYTFIEDSKSFYKIHTKPTTREEAEKICETEGATLFYAENQNETKSVLDLWKEKEPLSWFFVIISDLQADTQRLLNDLSHRLSNNTNTPRVSEAKNAKYGIEECVSWRRDTIDRNWCNITNRPFACKKSLSTEWNALCGLPDTDYIFDENMGKCYKIHLTPKNWTDALTVCNDEQSYLSIVDSQDEGEVLVNLTESAIKNKSNEDMSEAVYLGFHNRDQKGWTTVKGIPLEETGYTKWGNQQPDEGKNEQCGAMSFDGRLKSLGCQQKCFFICEHDIELKNSTLPEKN